MDEKNATLTQEAAVWIDPMELRPWGRNPRRNDHAVRQVAESIKTFGFGAPIVARAEDLRVIAGHTRIKAALKLGLEKVPVRLLDISEADADRLALADNKLGEIAEWDSSVLEALVRDDNVDLTALGWSEQEVNELCHISDPPSAPDDFAEVDEDISTDYCCPKCGYRWSGKTGGEE